MQLLRHRGLLVRPGVRQDAFAATNSKWSKFVDLLGPDDLLLDFGAYIGSVAVPAAWRGCSVLAYEPYPEHFEVLQANAADLPITCLQLAVTGEGGGVTLYVSGRSGLAHSIVPKMRPAARLEVDSVSFGPELREREPTAVKVTVEGAEYEFAQDLKNLPSYVTKLALDLHLILVKDYDDAAKEIIASLATDWEFVVGPRSGGGWGQLYYLVARR